MWTLSAPVGGAAKAARYDTPAGRMWALVSAKYTHILREFDLPEGLPPLEPPDLFLTRVPQGDKT